MENQDKPGYKEDFRKNYWYSGLIALLGVICLIYGVFFNPYGDNKGVLVGCIFLALSAGIILGGWMAYKKVFRGEINRGERDKGW